MLSSLSHSLSKYVVGTTFQLSILSGLAKVDSYCNMLADE
jgi:hypothetical protein